MVTTNGSAAPLTFYDSGSCPYAHRAWLALVEKEVKYNTVIVDLENKPQDFQDLYHEIMPNQEAAAKVPILIDGDAKVIESLLVVEYLDARFPDSGTRLIPSDPYEVFKVKLFVEQYSQLNMFKMFMASTPEEEEATTQALISGFKVINSLLLTHGSEDGGDFFLGGRYSYAETATSPFLWRLSVVGPALKGFDLFAILKQHGLDRFESWAKASLARESLKSTGPPEDKLIEGAKKIIAKFKAMSS